MGLNYVGMAYSHNAPATVFSDFLPPVSSDFVYYATKNFTVLRFSIMWEQAQPTLGGALDNNYMQYVDNAFTYATTYGRTLLLEVFDQGRYGGKAIGSAGGPTQAQFADLWSKISARYVGNPALYAYGLMNEPHDMPVPGVTWPAAAQAAINAIRVNDAAPQIFVCGEGFASCFSWVANNPNIHTLYDPQNKIVFEGHTYFDRDSSGTHYVWDTEVAAGDQLDGGAVLDTNIGVKRVAPFIAWGALHGVKIAVGEVGWGLTSDSLNWNIAGSNMLAYCQEKGVPTFYFCGRNEDDSYAFYCGPSTNTPGTDNSQMSVLTSYAGAVPPVAMTNGVWFTDPTKTGAVVPAGVTSITIEIIGGSGDGSDNGAFGGGGGGAGAYSKRTTKAVTAGEVIPFIVGAKSAGRAAAAGDTTCDGMTAKGGVSGSFGFAGLGGVASGGDVNTNGGDGTNGSGVASGKGGDAPNGGVGGSVPSGNGASPGGGGAGGGIDGPPGLGTNGGIKFSW